MRCSIAYEHSVTFHPDSVACVEKPATSSLLLRLACWLFCRRFLLTFAGLPWDPDARLPAPLLTLWVDGH